MKASTHSFGITRPRDHTFSKFLPKFWANAGLGLNSIWLLLARLAVQAQGVLLAILAARSLGAAEFGQFSLIASLIVLGNVLTTFGTDTLLIRQVARAHRIDIPEVDAAITLQLVFSFIFIAAIWLWTGLISGRSPEFIASTRLYSLSLLPLAFFSVYSAILRGMERMDLFLAAGLGTAALQILCVWLVFRAGGTILNLVAVLLVVQLFAMLLAGGLCRRYVPSFKFGLSLDHKFITQVARSAWPLALLSILAVIYQRSGVFFLSALGNDAMLGSFSAAARIVEALKLGHIAILGALLPALTRLLSEPNPGTHNNEAERLFKIAAGSLFVLSLLLSVGLLLFAGWMVSLLYGSGYSASVPALQLLGWMLIPYSLSSVLAVERVSQGQERQVVLALAVGLAAICLLNPLLIGLYRLPGACLAAVLGECIQVGTLWYLKIRPIKLQKHPSPL